MVQGKATSRTSLANIGDMCPGAFLEDFANVLEDAIVLANGEKALYNAHVHVGTGVPTVLLDTTYPAIRSFDTANLENICPAFKDIDVETFVDELRTLINEARTDHNAHAHATGSTATDQSFSAAGPTNNLTLDQIEKLNGACEALGQYQLGTQLYELCDLVTGSGGIALGMAGHKHTGNDVTNVPLTADLVTEADVTQLADS